MDSRVKKKKKVRSPKNGWDVFGGRAFSQHARSTSTAEGWLLGTVVHACGLNTQETDAGGSRGPDYEIKKLCKAKAIVNLVKRKRAEWEKIFASIHLIYKYFKYTKN